MFLMCSVLLFSFFLWWRHCDLWSCVHVNGTPAFIIVSLYLRNPIMLYIMCGCASFRAFCQRRCLMTINHVHTRCALPVCYATIARVLPRQREACRACPDKYLPLVFQYTTRVMASFAIFVFFALVVLLSRLPSFALLCSEFSSFASHCFGQWWVMSLQFK